MGVLYHPHGGRRTVLITSVMSLTVVTFPQEMEIGYGPDMMKTVKTTKAVKGDNGYEGYWAYGVVAQKMGVNAKDVTAIIEGIFELASMEIKMFGHARVASAFILKLKGKKKRTTDSLPDFPRWHFRGSPPQSQLFRNSRSRPGIGGSVADPGTP